ncbi:hypothetical protein TRAPUB_3423 [Trametes pubescens]|uniref:Magnesium transporter NIPA8 n=1 Tax=Trametes pubescens TaxID=154538 RepID=A0A1M2W7I2_TRAPU|nr:hypothetical protein TRAPUB_3423 [Trametes pubescens]
MAGDDSDPSISIPVGIIIGLLASFIQSLGLTVQRKSHVLNQSLPEDQQKVEHRRPLWLLGFTIFISSNLFGSIFQIASLPVVILAPLGAVSLLWNAFFARLLLGDVFSPWMLLGTLLIAGGAVLIAVFGIVKEPTHSLEDLLRLFSRPAFIAYFSLLGFVVLVWLVSTHVVEYSYTRRYKLADVSPPLSPLLAPNTAPSLLTTATTATSAVDPASATERTPLIDRKPHPRSKSPSPSTSIRSIIASPLSYGAKSPQTPLFLAFSYASISGILSGMCLLFAKSGVELLLWTFGGNNQFWRWQAWVLVISLVVFALLQLWYMHKSLVLADPTLVCPLAFCFYNLSSIVNGLVYFDQFSMLSTLHLLLVGLGIAVLLSGVWIISFPPGGGGGVDVGTWHEGDSAMELTGEDSDIEEESYEDEPLPMDEHARAESARGRTSSGHGLHVITEPPTPIAAPQLSPPPTTPARSSGRVSRPHGRQQTDSALVSSTPARRSRSTYTPSAVPEQSMSPDMQSPGSASSRRRRRTTLGASAGASQLSPTASHFAPSLSPSASAIGGFSIGLSPISPGFSIVPRERRRRMTGHGSSNGGASGLLGGDAQSNYGAGAGATSDAGSVGSPGRGWKMRRVVSEGDATGAAPLRVDGGVGSDSNSDGARRLSGGEEAAGLPHGSDLERAGGGGGQDAGDLEGSSTAGVGRRAKGRWKWLRSVLGSADPLPR